MIEFNEISTSNVVTGMHNLKALKNSCDES